MFGRDDDERGGVPAHFGVIDLCTFSPYSETLDGILIKEVTKFSYREILVVCVCVRVHACMHVWLSVLVLEGLVWRVVAGRVN